MQSKPEQQSTSKFPHKQLKSGKPNPKYVDLLDVDAPIAGQSWGVFSFITPTKILAQRNEYLFNEFVKQWELTTKMNKFGQFLNFVSHKYNVPINTLTTDYEEFVKDEAENIKTSSISDDYKNFLDNNEETLTAKFSKAHKFVTSVSGFKARGNTATQEEAENLAKKIRDIDVAHDVHVGPIGTWLAWDPDAYKTGRVEHMEEELNELVHEKAKNDAIAKAAFDQRVKDAKRQAIEENVKKAQKNNSLLTQTIDDNDNLVGVMNTNTQEFALNSSSSSSKASKEQIRNELFDGPTILTKQKQK